MGSFMSATIHVYHDRATSLREGLYAAGADCEVIAWSDPEAFVAGLHEVEVLLTESPPRDAWQRAGRLRLIQTMGAGVDGVLPAPGLPERVAVCCARGVFAAEAAEHALALLLALQRNLPAHVVNQSARRWRPFASGPLAARTAGVIGLGEIGRRVALGCSILGMRVLGCCRRPRPIDGVAEVFGADRLGELLSASSDVVVALPLTAETTGLIGREALSRLPPGARLIHVGRGGVIDEKAVLAALHTGHLGGAAFDVFEEEPLSEQSPWWTAPNTIVTPHVAGFGLRYMERVIRLLLDNVARLASGGELHNLVDRAAGY